MRLVSLSTAKIRARRLVLLKGSTAAVLVRAPSGPPLRCCRSARLTGYKWTLAPPEISALDPIDFDHVPEFDDAFWRDAELVEPDRTEQIALRVKHSVVDY